LGHEDGLGSDLAIEVLGNKLDLARASGDASLGVGVFASGDEDLGTLASVGWASDEELDSLVLVHSVGPSADD